MSSWNKPSSQGLKLEIQFEISRDNLVGLHAIIDASLHAKKYIKSWWDPWNSFYGKGILNLYKDNLNPTTNNRDTRHLRSPA